MIVCETCKRFIGDVQFKMDGDEEIKDVTGTCKKHGRVNAADCWEWEDLMGWPDAQKRGE